MTSLIFIGAKKKPLSLKVPTFVKIQLCDLFEMTIIFLIYKLLYNHLLIASNHSLNHIQNCLPQKFNNGVILTSNSLTHGKLL
jgi:hypothetical protein